MATLASSLLDAWACLENSQIDIKSLEMMNMPKKGLVD